MDINTFTDLMKTARKQAMQTKESGDQLKAKTLTMLWAQAQSIAKRDVREPTPSDIIGAARRMIKDLRATVELAQSNGRTDAAQEANAEIRVLESIVPTQDNLAIAAFVCTTIEALPEDARTIKSMGRIMGAVKGKFGNDLDMAEVSTIIRSQLNA